MRIIPSAWKPAGRFHRRRALAALGGAVFLPCARGSDTSTSSSTITVGGRAFTEQRILTQIVAQLLRRKTSLTVKITPGSENPDDDIQDKLIDVYVEYSGTAFTKTLNMAYDPSKDANIIPTIKSRFRELKPSLEWFDSLGFEDKFAIVIRTADCQYYKIHYLSEASKRPAWRIADGEGFELRPDGLVNLLTKGHIHLSEPPLTRKVAELYQLYQLLEGDRVDMIAANSTDRLLDSPSLTVLVDRDHIFPPYDAAIVARTEVLNQHPDVRRALNQLTAKISLETMRRLINSFDGVKADIARSKQERDDSRLDDEAAAQIAKGFLDSLQI
jgi:glycine betaine/choline ABC-type transport system substrate-binding protein